MNNNKKLKKRKKKIMILFTIFIIALIISTFFLLYFWVVDISDKDCGCPPYLFGELEATSDGFKLTIINVTGYSHSETNLVIKPENARIWLTDSTGVDVLNGTLLNPNKIFNKNNININEIFIYKQKGDQYVEKGDTIEIKNADWNDDGKIEIINEFDEPWEFMIFAENCFFDWDLDADGL